MVSPKRITLKDVANHAKLSLAGVSMALRDHPSLPDATKMRVKRVAERLGYVPDPVMCALAAHRSRLKISRSYSVIGLISNWEKADGWTSMTSAKHVIEGARARALALGYSVQHFWAREARVSPARFNAILEARGIRGLILAPLEKPSDELELSWEKFSVVTIERGFHYTRFPHVVPNQYSDMMLCWDKLRERGYARVGLVVRKDLAVRWGHQWQAAHSYAQSLAANPFDTIPTLVLEGGNQVEKIRAWLRKYHPEAVINRSDEFQTAASLEKLRIPEDVGYVSLNLADEEISNAAGILQPRTAMGSMAVDMLNNLLLHNQRGFQPVSIASQLDGEWRDGTTLPPITMESAE